MKHASRKSLIIITGDFNAEGGGGDEKSAIGQHGVGERTRTQKFSGSIVAYTRHAVTRQMVS